MNIKQLFFGFLSFSLVSLSAFGSTLDDLELNPPTENGIYKIEGEALRRQGLFVLGCTKAMPEHCENTALALCKKLGFSELIQHEATPAMDDSLQVIDGFSTDDPKFVKLVRTESTSEFEEVAGGAFLFKVVFLTSLTCELK